MNKPSDMLSFVAVGHVDHGKSSLIGRLLMDTDSVQPDVVEKVRRISKERGKKFEYAFLLDAFEEEREQGITIDITKIEFKTDKRRYVIIDAPGHKEFLKNMASGASRAEAAVLLVDAKEGVREQTKKHAYLLHLLGISQVNVVINKMDLVGYKEDRYVEVKEDVLAYLDRLDIQPEQVIPISATEGDNVTIQSKNMPWYTDSTVIDMLDGFSPAKDLDDSPLRMPLQDIYKFDDRRILAGRVEAGSLAVGDEIMVHPSGKTATIQTIEQWPTGKPAKTSASAGESIGITIDDEFYLKRGEIITHPASRPSTSTLIETTIFWMGRKPLVMDKEYLLKIGTQQVSCSLHSIDTVIDADTLEPKKNAGHLDRYEVGEVIIKTKEPVVFDPFQDVSTTGRFVIVDEKNVSGGGIISRVPELLQARSSIEPRSKLISPKTSLVRREDREKQSGHRGLVVWLTGLAGSGKSPIAEHLEQYLFEQGINAYYIDSSNVRLTLSSDLAFSEKQRKEHARRVAELANYVLDAGMVPIVSIISPYKDDREYARSIIGDKDFMEVHVDTPLDVCKELNPHGVYSKVEQGEISGVPGVDIDYEKSDRLVHTIHIENAEFDLHGIVEDLGKEVASRVKQ